MRIFRARPNLSGMQSTNIVSQEKFMNEVAKECTKRFMNISKMENAIFAKLLKNDIHDQTKALIQLILYLYSVGKGSEIAKDLFVASVRAIQKLDTSEALYIGERLNKSIFVVAVVRRMIGLYLALNDINRANELLIRLPDSEWNEGIRNKIESIRKLNKTILDEESSESKFFNILKSVDRPITFENVTMACLFDKFTYDCLSRELELIPVSKSNWKAVLSRPEVNHFFAESIWLGDNGGWKYAMSSFNTAAGEQLRELLRECKEQKITTIFWNKEDPVNYDAFIEVAKHFDFIFTSDEDSISRYVEDCGHENVYSLPFAAQPIIHNPIRNTLPEHEICFAGSWYVREHGNRKQDTKLLLDASSSYGLHIFDRFYGTDNRNRFPDVYDDFVKGSLTYKETCMAYRVYKIFLNVNSVNQSPTMFSRRVFEILASSTALLSTPSKGMELMLGDYITVVEDMDSADKALTHLLEDDFSRNAMAHQGYREVMNRHTYSDRMQYVLKVIGIEREWKNLPLVSCITCSNRPQMIDEIIQNYDSQKYRNRELILLLQAEDELFEEIEDRYDSRDDINILRQEESEVLGAVFNRGIDASNGDYIAKFDDDDKYGPNYLMDGLLPFNFTSASVVGKLETFLYHEASGRFYRRFPGKRHRYQDLVMGATIIAKREVFDTVRFAESMTGEDSAFLKGCKEKGFKIYATDPYNWVHMRYSSSDFHTWKVEDESLLRSAEKIARTFSIEKDVFI